MKASGSGELRVASSLCDLRIVSCVARLIDVRGLHVVCPFPPRSPACFVLGLGRASQSISK